MSNIITFPGAAKGPLILGYGHYFLDSGIGNARLLIFGTTRPAAGVSPGGDPLVQIVLAKPSGSLDVDGAYVLEMGTPGGYMALASGDGVWGRIINGNDEWAGDGDVSAEAGSGAFKLQGEDTHINAGGYVVLATSKLRIA